MLMIQMIVAAGASLLLVIVVAVTVGVNHSIKRRAGNKLPLVNLLSHYIYTRSRRAAVEATVSILRTCSYLLVLPCVIDPSLNHQLLSCRKNTINTICSPKQRDWSGDPTLKNTRMPECSSAIFTAPCVAKLPCGAKLIGLPGAWRKLTEGARFI